MPGADRKLKTLYDKVFEDHIVNEQDDGTILLYIGMLVSVLPLWRWPLLNMLRNRPTFGPRSHITCMAPAPA
jgi:hypothetical protein